MIRRSVKSFVRDCIKYLPRLIFNRFTNFRPKQTTMYHVNMDISNNKLHNLSLQNLYYLFSFNAKWNKNDGGRLQLHSFQAVSIDSEIRKKRRHFFPAIRSFTFPPPPAALPYSPYFLNYPAPISLPVSTSTSDVADGKTDDGAPNGFAQFPRWDFECLPTVCGYFLRGAFYRGS